MVDFSLANKVNSYLLECLTVPFLLGMAMGSVWAGDQNIIPVPEVILYPHSHPNPNSHYGILEIPRPCTRWELSLHTCPEFLLLCIVNSL